MAVLLISVVALGLSTAFRLVQQYEEGGLLRLGQVVGMRKPGLALIVPLIGAVRHALDPTLAEQFGVWRLTGRSRSRSARSASPGSWCRSTVTPNSITTVTLTDCSVARRSCSQP